MPKPNPELDLDSRAISDPYVAECVDPAQIRSWIEDCEENHGDRCNTKEHQSLIRATELKFIDVVHMCVVNAPPDARYFALSYMWGGVTQMLLTTESWAELSLQGSLQQYWSRIPEVIQDAIQFVAALDERYLWVDSLCIVQNDAQMKYHQILQMGAIYNGAVASLVGVVGLNAHAGLAGVRPGTRVPEQKRPLYENVYLVNPGLDEEYTALRKPRDRSPYRDLGKRIKVRQLDLNERLIKSNYSTRAWTYQEQLLSRRCIYFMDNMVYYHCRSAIRGENKAAPYSKTSQDIRPLCLFIADPVFSGNPLHYQRTLGAVYAGIVTEYTRKKLSYPLDVLDAFSGISSAMEKLCGWRVIVGMPENLLDYAILWTPTESSQRRYQLLENAFPSWSWSGWCAEVDYDNIWRNDIGFEPYLADLESLIHKLSIYDRNGFRCIQSSVPASKQLVGSIVAPESSLQKEFSHWISRISNSETPKNVLLFQAFTWPFKSCTVSKTMIEQPFVSASRPSLGYIKREIVKLRFHLISRRYEQDHETGFLYGASPEIFSMTEPDNYEIVFLSTNKQAGEDFEDWNPHCQTNFMLIKWTGNFAERIALGKIRRKMIFTVQGYNHHIGLHEANLQFEYNNRDITRDVPNICHWKTIRLI